MNEILYHAFVAGPAAIGILYFVVVLILALFGRLPLFHDTRPALIWVCFSVVVALFAWDTDIRAVEQHQITVFLVCVPWLWLMAMANQFLGIFHNVESFLPLESEILRQHRERL